MAPVPIQDMQITAPKAILKKVKPMQIIFGKWQKYWFPKLDMLTCCKNP